MKVPDIKITREKTLEYMPYILLIFLIIFSTTLRTSTLSDTYVISEADPWWFLRHAELIQENGGIAPEWDIQSHYPPGRPFDTWSGWSYFIYLISFFVSSNIILAANIAPIIVTGLFTIAAFLLGRHFTNNWGGVFTAIFVTFSPIITQLSMAGYTDTDALVVFLTLFSLFSLFYAFDKRTIKGYVFATLTNLFFIFSWVAGWWPLLLFAGFFFIITMKDIITKNFNDLKDDVKSFLILIVPINIIATLLGLTNIVWFIIERFLFFTGEMIVNISVAEMSKISIQGFMQSVVPQKIGDIPFWITMLGIPILLYFRTFKQKKIEINDVFLFMWLCIMAVIMSQGVRFSLLFSLPVYVIAGYLLGNGFEQLPKIEFDLNDSKQTMNMIILGGLVFMSSIYVSNAMIMSNYDYGFDEKWANVMDWIENNTAEDALIYTWWDPGHMISATGRRNFADGAHCPEYECNIYDHNDRIRDAGKFFSTDDLNEALEILKKDLYLTDEQCNQVKEKYGSIVPEDACDPPEEIYIIASSDLAVKFQWLNYFGGYEHERDTTQLGQCNPPGTTTDTWVWCIWGAPLGSKEENFLVYPYTEDMRFMIIEKEGNLFPVADIRLAVGTQTALIKRMAIYDNGTYVMLDYSDEETSFGKISGALWVQPDFRYVAYLPDQLIDSMYSRLFYFDGVGIENVFEPMYNENGIKIYKVNKESLEDI